MKIKILNKILYNNKTKIHQYFNYNKFVMFQLNKNYLQRHKKMKVNNYNKKY